MMTILELVNEIFLDDEKITQKAISVSAILIENYFKNSYNFKSNVDMLKILLNGDELADYRLNDGDIEVIVDSLKILVKNKSKNSASAVWALGKVCGENIKSFLLEVLEANFRLDDELSYQALIALDNQGLDSCGDILKRVAVDGLSKSKEYARRKLEKE